MDDSDGLGSSDRQFEISVTSVDSVRLSFANCYSSDSDRLKPIFNELTRLSNAKFCHLCAVSLLLSCFSVLSLIKSTPKRLSQEKLIRHLSIFSMYKGLVTSHSSIKL